MCENQSGESFLCGLDNEAYNSVTKTGNCMSVGLGIISCWVGEWGLGLTVAMVNCWNLSFSQPKILIECLPKNSSDNLELDYLPLFVCLFEAKIKYVQLRFNCGLFV